jgi:hypothetical protein
MEITMKKSEQIKKLRDSLKEIKSFEDCVMKDGDAYEQDKMELIDHAIEQCVKIATKALEETQ